MAKDRDDELNTDLPDGEEFSLESILAEFGSGNSRKTVKEDTIPFPIVPKRGGGRPVPGGGRVVEFPGSRQAEPPEFRPDGPPVERQAAPTRQEEPEEEEQPPRRDEKVLEFPGEEGPAADNPIAEKLNRLVRRADDYASHMYEEEGKEHDEQVRRAEAYIPGTDEEEEPERPRRERRARRQPPPAPDLPAGDLARRYNKGLKSLGVRGTLTLLLFFPALYLSVELLPYPALFTPQMRVWALAGLQVLAMLLGLDGLLRGLFRVFRLEFGMDTLLAFASAATLADALTMFQLDSREGEMPYCAAIVLGLALLLKGTARKRRGQRLACRTAASASHPYLVTLDEGKWNGREAYAKWSGEPIGVGRQMQASDLSADCPPAAYRLPAAQRGGLHRAGGSGAAAVVPVRHPHRLHLPVGRPVLLPALAAPVPPAEPVGSRHRRLGRGHRHRRQRHPAYRHRLLPAGLRGPQRH